MPSESATAFGSNTPRARGQATSEFPSVALRNAPAPPNRRLLVSRLQQRSCFSLESCLVYLEIASDSCLCSVGFWTLLKEEKMREPHNLLSQAD